MTTMPTPPEPAADREPLAAYDVRFGTPHYGRARRLMLRAFPPEERIAFPLLVLNSLRRSVRFQVFYDGAQFAGLLYACFGNDLVYALFLAVNDEVRSRGYGSRILGQLKAEAGSRPVVLEIEPLDEGAANYEQRVRRLRFYERNGFRTTGFASVEDRCEYALLTTQPEGEAFPAAAFEQLHRQTLAGLASIRVEDRRPDQQG